MGAPLLELLNVSKSFGPTRALDRVCFTVLPGEVHVLAGENGAGKSTLIKILSGVLSDFEGELRAGSAGLRIAAIHQELSLIGPMSVADNLALGMFRDRQRALWSLRRPRLERERAKRLLEQCGLELDPDTSVESLPLGARQQLEIERALVQGARVIVMDEPTSALAEPEAERLFARIRQLASEGAGIVYISHRMEEIFRLADRITVLRDGKRVLTAPAAELDRERLIAAMIGRDLSSLVRHATDTPAAAADAPALEVRELTLADRRRPGRRLLDGISCELARGEIVGVAGLAGSGAATLLGAIFGAHGRPHSRTLSLAGQPYQPSTPRAAIERGIVLLASDRRLSLIAELGIAENVTLSSLGRWSRGGVIDRGAERRAAAELLSQLATSGMRAIDDPVSQLSGGNQQKVAIARCLAAEPRVLLLDEPTRGIDIGAKSDVYALIQSLAERGLGILLVASELEELIGLSHRVLVLQRGRIVDELSGDAITRERILASAMGGGPA